MRIRVITIGLAVLASVSFLSCSPVEIPEPESINNEVRPQARPAEAAAAPAPAASAPVGLKRRIEAAVGNVRKRQLMTSNAFWTIFHGILGLGPGVTLKHDFTGQTFNAVDHITAGGELRGLRFIVKNDGLDVQMGPQMVGQGHQDQFAAEMTQWGMPATRVFRVDGREYTFMDFVRYSQANARVTASQELSWTILLVGQHVGLDMTWTNLHGEKLHFEDMVKYELDASVENAACGGTHRLFGLSWVYHLHLIKGGKTEGVYKAVAEKTAKYRDTARKYQNGDGCFSTEFFKEKGNNPDKTRRINSTGHTLEWLALALRDEELTEPWVQDAANALSLLILDQQGMPIESGSLYHAVHGLLIYYARVYGRTSFIPAELAIPLPPGWRGGGKLSGRPDGA